MSRTDKDLPYDVKARRSGKIEHDHTKGVCVIGTYADSKRLRQARHNHLKNCPRYVKGVLCIHDKSREVLQAAVEHARAKQRTYYMTLMDAGVPRSLSSEAIYDMLAAGRIPNCTEAKTHKINVDDIDLHFKPGESIKAANRIHTWMRYRQPEILRVRYDETIACKFCDNWQDVTCDVVEKRMTRRWYCDCRMCAAEAPEGESAREARDNNRRRAREYNTYGETE